MLTQVEALNYRSLRYIQRPLGRFHVLVGPNASGKTTFLDVVAFISQLLSKGLESALEVRSSTFEDLLFRHQGVRFELAVEAVPPSDIRQHPAVSSDSCLRYELVIAYDEANSQVVVEKEYLRLTKQGPQIQQRSLFPESPVLPATLVRSSRPRGPESRTLLTRIRTGRANYYSETYREAGKGWNPQWDLKPNISALANLPADESKFPMATWFKQLLANGVETLVLDSTKMRRPSPPGQGLKFRTDGSNLPWVIDELKEKNPLHFRDWVAHIRTALPELEGIKIVHRNEDRHKYIVLQYSGDLEVPSWTASDGTLRLLALTLPAYLDDERGIMLIEEPENGIHPRAIEAIFTSLSNVYESQVILATHSPVILNIVAPQDVLCFAKDEFGATDIVSGDQHPSLADWQRDVSLGTLFAAGVLG